MPISDSPSTSTPCVQDADELSGAKKIFFEVMDMEDESLRSRYLDTACGKDPPLRARVESLLRARVGSEEFLGAPAALKLLAMELEIAEEELWPREAGEIGCFGDYVLLDEIARGSAGVVFRARQVSLDRIVALKMPRDHGLVADSADLRRFRAEVAAAAALNHPNIVPVYEVGEHEGQAYYSMRLIGGGSLHRQAARYRKPETAVRLMAKVIRAVAAAHEAGLLHRDIKPGNILLDASDEPYLTDFGVVRRMGGEEDLTLPGQLMGTPYYMAPEQVRGEGRTLTPAADVYSLGAVLYELLAREKPITGGSMIEVLNHTLEKIPKSPRALNPSVDRDLECIVMRCLEKAPDARYPSASAMAEDLERWLRREPIRARPAGPLRRMGKWIRRRPYHAVILLLAAGLGVTLAESLRFRARHPPPPGVEELAASAGNWTAVPLKQPLDVISLIYLDRGPASNWAREKNSLTAFPGPPERLQSLFFPVHASGDYDLLLDFTVTGLQRGINETPLLQFLVGSRLLQLDLATASGCRCPQCVPGGTAVPLDAGPGIAHPFGPVSGLQWIRTKSVKDNDTRIFHHDLRADLPHTLLIQVRLLEKKRGSVTVLLDGRPFLSWSGPLTELRETDPVKDGFGNGGGFSYFHFMNPSSYTISYNRMILIPLSGTAWRRTPN